MIQIAPHITAFLREYLPVQCGASPHTCDSYAYTFQLLFNFASERFKITPSELYLEQIDAPLVMDFLKHIEDERNNSPKTRNARLAAIKSFMHFVEHRVPSALDQILHVLAIPSKKTEKLLITHLSLTEIQAILNAPDVGTRMGIRDRAMFHLCFAAALRVSELTSLLLTAVIFHPQPIIRVMGKGRRERSLPLLKQTTADIRAWLSVRGSTPAPELFINSRGEPLTRVGVTYLLHKYVKIAETICPSLKESKYPHTCYVTLVL